MASIQGKLALLAGCGATAVIALGGVAHAQVIATQAEFLSVGASAVAADAQSGAQVDQIQAPAAPQAATNEVQVTATRVERKGFVAPTPTTILTSADLQVGGATNLGAALGDLPSYAPTVSAATTRTNVDTSQYNANLRDLGPTRTLVLIDGMRPVPTTPGGASFGFDLNILPSFLIDHVEVVTGGASAQWGSDAVAGVVNVVMKKSLVGAEADIQAGSDTHGFGTREESGNFAFGTSFNNGRGQVLFGVGYDDVKGVYPASLGPAGDAGLISNPAYTATNGLPQTLFVQGLRYSTGSTGGLITSGPLKGTAFGPGGTTSAFQYGEYGLNASSGGLMIGGDPTSRYPGDTTALVSPDVRLNAYGRAIYDVSSHTRLTLDLLLAHEESNGPLTADTNLANITIKNTNAFLPAQIASEMAADKITSFTLGRYDSDFGPIFNRSVNNTVQVKIGADGELGPKWSWDTFYSFGETHRNDVVGNQEITANFANAVNSVISPTTGQPVCAVALTNPSTSCVPINLFGQGSPSAAALNYVLGNSMVATYLYQHEAAANIRGEPFSLWAGPVSVAAGLEYRDEGTTASTDPISKGLGFTTLNIAVISPGSYSVGEGYLETVAPLVRDVPLFNKLDFNGAVRVSDYSTSGAIDSWKVGLTDVVAPDLLLRAASSRDIRAPNLNELFTGRTTSIGNVLNPLTNATVVGVYEYGGGNQSLLPEISTTNTLGATYQPHWTHGLRLSLDYYDINIKNAIATEAAQTILNQCYLQKISAACSEVTTVNGVISTIQATYINLSSYEASGIDFEGDYSARLANLGLPGSVNAKWLTTYVNSLKTISGTTVTRLAGSIQNGLPRWRSTFFLRYDLDAFEATARVRYVGGGAYTLIETVNTDVKAQTYLDLGVKWKVPTHKNLYLYADINNVADNVYVVGAAANPGLFDYIGRTYDVGLRVAF